MAFTSNGRMVIITIKRLEVVLFLDRDLDQELGRVLDRVLALFLFLDLSLVADVGRFSDPPLAVSA